MSKKILILLFATLSLVACGEKKEEGAMAETAVVKEIKKPVKSVEIKKEALSKKIEGAATLVGLNEVNHTSPGGEIEKIYVKNGDWVEEGELLVVIDNEAIESAYKSAEASYLSAKALYEQTEKFAEIEVRNSFEQAKSLLVNARETLAKSKRGGNAEERATAESAYNAAETALSEAESTLKKYKRLYDEELISEDQFLKVQTAYNQAVSSYTQAENNLALIKKGADAEDIKMLEASLESAEISFKLAEKNLAEKTWEYSIQTAKSQYLSAKAQYENAKASYDDLTIEAKISGYVANLSNKVFDKVEEDGRVLTVIDDSIMEFELGVNPQELPYLKKGNIIDLYSKDFNGMTKGKLTEINPIANETDRKFMVKGIVENTDKTLKSGMYVNVVIEGESVEGIAISKEAIVIRGLNKYIFVNKNGVAERRSVTLGNEYGDKVEIVNDILKEGEKLIIEGQYLLENKDVVEEVN
jgi:RND family efflux transporter MFP subunit